VVDGCHEAKFAPEDSRQWRRETVGISGKEWYSMVSG
jgi:hypothetical protein